MTNSVTSPCVKLCKLNTDDFCTGCLRHLDEIVGWNNMSDETHRSILARIEKRKKVADSMLGYAKK